MALLALQNYSNARRPSTDQNGATYSLRLLVAAYCQNTTSYGLAIALERLPTLAFLDLSNTLAVRENSVLSTLGSLHLMQVLKLRNVHLRDEDVDTLADAIGIRVRSLDISGNHLTDRSVRTLLSACFLTEIQSNGGDSAGRHQAMSSLIVEDWPAGIVQPDQAVLDEFKSQSYDERLVRRLTSNIVSRLPYEDLPSSGVTHLYIANNNLTVEGVGALIRSKKLYVLDAGTVDTIKAVPRPRSQSSSSFAPSESGHVRLPGAEKLVPTLSACAPSLTSLRLHHAVITELAPATEKNPPIAKCELSAESSIQELDGPVASELDAAVYELDAEPPLYELGTEAPPPRFELPGDSMHVVVSPPVGKKPILSKKESQLGPRRGSALAPEVVEQLESSGDISPILNATGLSSTAQIVNGISSPEKLKLDYNAQSSDKSRNPELQLALIEKQRRELRSGRLEKPHSLVPGMLPKLRTITLTDVPSFENSRQVVNALIQFIKDCASEAELADLQASLAPKSRRKPGQRQSKHHRQNAREIFALQQIVLEMAPANTAASPHIAKASRYPPNRTRSSTEDADSEAFWSAAENDFTFFDDDEECGLPALETSTSTPYSILSEKMTLPVAEETPPTNARRTQLPARTAPMIDVVQELAQFRKERKAAYEEVAKRGMRNVQGYWPGEVKVVRGQHSADALDYYGNHFESGGIYR